MTNILYITYGESPLSALIQTQVIELLSELTRSPGVSFTWLAFLSPTDTFLNRIKLQSLQKRLCERGIELIPVTIPILYSRYFLPRRPIISLLLPTCVSNVRSVIRSRNISILHCRSYMASLVGAIVVSESKTRQMIFDPRSLFPEENISAGNWKRDSETYRTWKRLEKNIVACSSAVIGVSEAFSSLISGKNLRTIFHLIPCFAPAAKGNRPTKTAARIKLNLNPSALVVVYLGSLGAWNSPKSIASFFHKIFSDTPDAILLLITKSKTEQLLAELKRLGLPESCVRMVSCEPEEVPCNLAAADIGLQIMLPGADSNSRLGVKVVEYARAELPVAVNSHAGAAYRAILQYGIGIGFEDDDANFSSKISELRAMGNSQAFKDRARMAFSDQEVILAYKRIYQQLATEPKPHREWNPTRSRAI